MKQYQWHIKWQTYLIFKYFKLKKFNITNMKHYFSFYHQCKLISNVSFGYLEVNFELRQIRSNTNYYWIYPSLKPCNVQVSIELVVFQHLNAALWNAERKHKENAGINIQLPIMTFMSVYDICCYMDFWGEKMISSVQIAI